MSAEQPVDAALVPEPTPAPAEQQLSGEQILAFDPQAAVAGGDGAAAVAPESAAVPASTAPLVPENLVETTCPNCGTVGRVDFARRESSGFCPSCDFPLFWSRDRIVVPANGGPDESGLRRLPGTAGRSALASLLCPACAERNPATGVTCVRCGADLHPKAPQPIVVLPEPEPQLQPVEPHRSWWPYIIAVAAALVALAVVLIVVYT